MIGYQDLFNFDETLQLMVLLRAHTDYYIRQMLTQSRVVHLLLLCKFGAFESISQYHTENIMRIFHPPG